MIVCPDEYGGKELLAMTDSFRESTQRWRDVLLDLKRRGLEQDQKLAISDGALGFRAKLLKMSLITREQRCWLHNTMKVLNAMPKSVQAKARHLACRHEGRSLCRIRLSRRGLRRIESSYRIKVQTSV